MPDISAEIKFKTARSGGKGGQNVNKVETMVEGYWHVNNSQLFTDAEKSLITEKLSNRINADGMLLVKSQEARTQLDNKARVLHKMQTLVEQALIVPRKRKKSKPTLASRPKRLESKKLNSSIKQARQKPRLNE